MQARSDVTQRLQILTAELRAEGLDRLPAERLLAGRLGVTRSAVRRGLDELAAAGLIRRVPGRTGGAVLTRSEDELLPAALFEPLTSKIERDTREARGLPRVLGDQGRAHATIVLDARVVPAPSAIAARLRLGVGSDVVSLVRLRSADGEALSLERMFLEAARYPGLLDEAALDAVYDTLAARYGVEVASVDETIDVVDAPPRVAGLLGVASGAALFVFRRTAATADGSPVESSVDLFRGDRTRVRVGSAVRAVP